MSREAFLQKWVLKNGSYKLVSLFVALVLWVAILGRKDFSLTHELPIEFKLPKKTYIANDVSDIVRVKIGGPRLALKRFTAANDKIVIDLRRAGIGRTNLRIQESEFELPRKVRLIAISPSFLSIEVRRQPKVTKEIRPKEPKETESNEISIIQKNQNEDKKVRAKNE